MIIPPILYPTSPVHDSVSYLIVVTIPPANIIFNKNNGKLKRKILKHCTFLPANKPNKIIIIIMLKIKINI